MLTKNETKKTVKSSLIRNIESTMWTMLLLEGWAVPSLCQVFGCFFFFFGQNWLNFWMWPSLQSQNIAQYILSLIFALFVFFRGWVEGEETRPKMLISRITGAVSRLFFDLFILFLCQLPVLNHYRTIMINIFLMNDTITASCQTNVSPKNYTKH